jgi:hypothetical protein
MPLSPREERNLAAIEDNLNADDPRLAQLFGALPPAPDRPLPVRPADTAILTAALAALAGLHTITGGLHPLVTAILTCLLGVGWIVYAVRPGRLRHTNEHPGTMRTEAGLAGTPRGGRFRAAMGGIWLPTSSPPEREP